jgi:hypothetical protein
MIQLQPDGALLAGPFLAVTTGILILFAGKAVNQRVGFLREYNIPEPMGLNVGDSDSPDRGSDQRGGGRDLRPLKSSIESDWCWKEPSAGLVRELEEKKVIVLPCYSRTAPFLCFSETKSMPISAPISMPASATS